MFFLQFILLISLIQICFCDQITSEVEALAFIDLLSHMGCNSTGCELNNFGRHSDCDQFAPDALECDSQGRVTFLFLFNDKLSGTIDGPSLAKLTALTSLELSFDRGLGGTLPTEFNQLTDLEDISMYSNSFVGDIPDLDRLTSLTSL